MENNSLPSTILEIDNGSSAIILGGGCFWCIEAIFNQMRGVISAESGYAGGWIENPSYEQVCDKNTGHAEVVKVIFNPSLISASEILEVFFEIHDPTTVDRQGNDVGPQYRSIIFYSSEDEQIIAQQAIAKAQNNFGQTIVTELVPFINFYKAETYHQEYYYQHTNQPYCSAVITPKIKKFQKKYVDKLK
ncbi:MAG: peptide-methionine (S)-S-oxide reductase MsrA [Saprospiraceae bacterium]